MIIICVGTRSMRIHAGFEVKEGTAPGIVANRRYDSRKPAGLLHPKRRNRSAHQVPHVRLTLRTLDRHGAGGAITGQSLLLAA